MYYSISQEYYNHIYQTNRHITLYWDIPKGFESKSEAMETVYSIGENPFSLAYICFKNKFYPIGHSGIQRQIIYTKDLIFLKYGADGFFKVNYSKSIIINHQKIGSSIGKYRKTINDGILDLFKKIDNNVYALYSYEESFFKSKNDGDALVLFAELFFSTLINVYELNVLDSCFPKYNNNNITQNGKTPYEKKLYLRGISYYNPYSEKCKYIPKNTTYTVNDYINKKYHIEKTQKSFLSNELLNI